MQKPKIVAIYGSPRRKGNTAALLKKAVEGARDFGAEVEEMMLRDLKISPCLEIYGCTQAGECAIKDDFQKVRDKILDSEGLMLINRPATNGASNEKGCLYPLVPPGEKSFLMECF
ncbi:MAG: flavodoxin family protein [Desulfobacterales bacterium]